MNTLTTAMETAAHVVMAGHVSPETAHLTFAYPFGQNRCVRREWIEYSTKGAGKSQYRLVMQTTDRPFNYAYTEKIEKDGQAAADAWARSAIESGAVVEGRTPGVYHWNARKAGTYSFLLVMVEQPLDDGSGRVGVGAVAIQPHSGPEDFARFSAQVGGQLDESQAKRLAALESHSRKASPTSWAEWDAQQARG